MRVLLDECIPVQVATELSNHDVRTIRRMGGGARRTASFCNYQQRIAKLRLGLVTLVAPSNEIEALRLLLRGLRQAVLKVKPGQVIRLA